MIGLVAVIAGIGGNVAVALVLGWYRDRPGSWREFFCGPKEDR
jgi:hypothetical protein